MKLIWKIIKYLIIFTIVCIALIYVTETKPKNILVNIINISMKYKGLMMEESKWEEFDFTDIAGETQAIIFGGLVKQNALGNYRIRTFYPFDGTVGFVGGSDYNKQNELQNIELFDKKTITQEEYDSHWPDKYETAYLFRTDDDGETFTKDNLGNGYIAEIIKHKKNYYAIVENYLLEAKTFTSKDNGKRWKEFFHESIELFFDTKHFIYSELTNIKSVNAPLRYKYFYTNNGGKSAVPLSTKIVQYAINMQINLNYRLRFDMYQGKLIFLDNEDLVFIDIETQKEDRKHLSLPKGYKIATPTSRIYGENKYEFMRRTRGDRHNTNVLQINKEDGRPYIYLQKIDEPEEEPAQLSIWYPLENKHIVFNKDISKIVPFKVSGNYIGGFIKKTSLLVHIWSLDYGENWHYEVLPDYYLLNGPKVAYDKIWMTALVRGERPDGKEGYPKVKGSFLVMGTLKSIKEEVSEIIPKDFTLKEYKK